MAEKKSKRVSAVTPTPHDAVFKQFLTDPVSARDFMQLHLPTHLQAICDFTTLKLESGSFIEESLRPYYSDVLYSLKTKTGEGYIHVLIEHQSTPDRHMAFRLLRYAVAAMQRHLDAGHQTLPLVIPVLFYAGKRTPYPYSTHWLQLFIDPALAHTLYTSDFPLVDVTAIPDEEIMHHRSLAALTLLQKHILVRDISELKDRLAFLLMTEPITGQQLDSLINYIVYTGDTEDAEALIRDLAQQVPRYGDKLMTIAQKLEQQGIEKGIEQGIEKGRREEAVKIALAMLSSGLDSHAVMKMTGLSAAEIAQIRL